MPVTTTLYQIGQSGTFSQNFTLTTPAVPDGTAAFYRGNAGSVISYVFQVDVSNNVVFGGNVSDGSGNQLGYKNLPQQIVSANYTCVAADSGTEIFHPSADTTARTWTIPSNGSVPYPIGTAITFTNWFSAGVITVAIASDTMYMAGTGSTGSRTLAAGGTMTVVKKTLTSWLATGVGMT